MSGIAAENNAPFVVESLAVDQVWAGHPVPFALLTHGDRQFVAYYDANRDMQVAWRDLGDTHWDRVALPEKLGWDTHNYVTLAVDSRGYLHLSGNMHCAPLVYFRTREPLEPKTFERAAMTGELENRVTYPEFIEGAGGALVFTYRDGQSGSGDQIFNTYDVTAKTWRRLLDKPLTSGMGKMNAYFEGPLRGPDGRFHLCWVWRDTGDCATNHDPCYARSADLVHWETVAGKALSLPIAIDSADIVDHVPIHGGVLNGNVKLGFDSKYRVIIGYHKFDTNGITQVYNARFDDGAWRLEQASDWAYRWDFGGGGAIETEIELSGVKPYGHGRLKQTYRHDKYGSGGWILDEKTLNPLGPLNEAPSMPPELKKPAGTFPGLAVQFEDNLGSSGKRNTRYILRWETLGANRDRPRSGDLPPPSVLQVIKLGEAKVREEKRSE